MTAASVAAGGRCLCGAVTFRFTGDPLWCLHCHCESCRRQTSSAFTSFLGLPVAAFAWTGAGPKVFASSPGVRRSFCGTCGSPMAFESERWPGEIHLYAASLDRPELYAATGHVHDAERLPWLHLDDGLPRHARDSGG